MSQSQSSNGVVPGRGYKRGATRAYLRPPPPGAGDGDAITGGDDYPDLWPCVRAVKSAGWLISFADTSDGGTTHVVVLHAGRRTDYYAHGTSALAALAEDIANTVTFHGSLP